MLNLSAQAPSDLQEPGSASSDPDHSDIGEPEADIGSETEDMDMDRKQEDKEAGAPGAPGTMFQMMNQIQSLIKMTVEKAKQEEKNNSSQKCEYICCCQACAAFLKTIFFNSS